MMLRLPEVLTLEQVRAIRARLDAPDSPWVDGRATAGHQGALVKHNEQIDERSELARELGDAVLAALETNLQFISGALPRRVYPPLFNRYREGMGFGSHVDGAVRLLPGSGERLRADIAATLFLAGPDEYDGGELAVEDNYGVHLVKLDAGDLVLYPAASLHAIEPITRGARVACFFFVQSMVRDAGRRALLYDLDSAIRSLSFEHEGDPAVVRLTSVYHNLLREWAET